MQLPAKVAGLRAQEEEEERLLVLFCFFFFGIVVQFVCLCTGFLLHKLASFL